MDEEELLDALSKLFEKAQIEPNAQDLVDLGKFTDEEVADILAKTGKNIAGFKKTVKFHNVRHIVKLHSKNHERLTMQKQIETEDFIKVLRVINEYKDIVFQEKDHSIGRHQDCFLFSKIIENEFTLVMEIIWGKKEISLKTMWIKK